MSEHRELVLNEIAALLGTGPELVISQVEHGLGVICAQYPHDQWVSEICVDVWAKVNLVAQTANNAVNIAAAAREVAVMLQKQRDAAVSAHTDLLDAVRTANTQHQLVGDMVEMLQSDIYGDGGYHSINPAMDITENAMIPVKERTAAIFHECLVGQRLYALPDEKADELRGIMAQFMKGFVKMVKQAEDAAKAGAA